MSSYCIKSISLSYIIQNFFYIPYIYSFEFFVIYLELAKDNNENIRIEGPIKELPSGIPFDYKGKNPRYFTKEYRDRMIDNIYENSNRNGGKFFQLYDLQINFPNLNCSKE